MLHVNSLTKHYGKKTILQDMTFTVEPGEVIGLVGENGAGKSTLLNVLASLSLPTSGTIYFDGLHYQEDHKKVRRHIGFVPQEIAVWEEFTVKENMMFFEKLSWSEKTKQTLREICLDMKLDKWKEPVRTLSGGMKRKLNMAISLIHDPRLLLLDEPTAGIDLKSRKEIGSYLHHQARSFQKTILYTSHDMDEIIQLCDRVFCIGQDPFYKQVLEEAGKYVMNL